LQYIFETQWIPSGNLNSLLLKITIEIVDFPSYKMVDLSISSAELSRLARLHPYIGSWNFQPFKDTSLVARALGSPEDFSLGDTLAAGSTNGKNVMENPLLNGKK